MANDPNEFMALVQIIREGGTPAAVMVLMYFAFHRFKNDPRRDADSALDRLGEKIDHLSTRMTRVETILEERK